MLSLPKCNHLYCIGVEDAEISMTKVIFMARGKRRYILIVICINLPLLALKASWLPPQLLQIIAFVLNLTSRVVSIEETLEKGKYQNHKNDQSQKRATGFTHQQ